MKAEGNEHKTLHQKVFDLQCEVGAIAKDSKNPFYKSKYFDINGLLKHIQPLLEKNRLLLIQPIENGKVKSIIRDIDSKESFSSEMPLPEIQDPQKMGSAITYFRRYTLQSLLALQAEDDDGNTASTAKKSKPVITPDNDRWNKAVHAIASGKYDIAYIKDNYKISKKDSERLVTEALQVQQEATA